MRRARHALAIASVTLTATSTIGCWAIAKRESDLDRTPIVNTGAGATIIYPGQSAPPHPGNYHPREAGYGQGVMTSPGAAQSPQGAAPYSAPGTAAPGTSHAPAGVVAPGVAVPPPEYASRSGSSSGSGSGYGTGSGGSGAGLTMLGGAETEQTHHVTVDEEPKWLKYLALPFAVAAAPFQYGADKLAGEPEPAPPVPRLEHQPRPEIQTAPPPVDYETARLQGMERELAQRGTPSAAPALAPAPSATSGAGSSGFADELAALRRRATPAPIASAPPQPAFSSAAEAQRAEGERRPNEPGGQVDRDGDGRTDHWIQRENGVITRELFDENFDANPDRTLVYDPSSHEVVSIEEDANFDGRNDAWTALRGGQVVGRRVDGNSDGQVDGWSFYRAGVITRLERDANGDGFRDHVAYYRDGRLVREERDDDSDGRTDLVRYFDDGERVERVEEDADGDGEMDVVSHYEDGRLSRREVLDASVLGLGQSDGTEHN